MVMSWIPDGFWSRESPSLGGRCKSRGWWHLVTTSVCSGCPDKVEFPFTFPDG